MTAIPANKVTQEDLNEWYRLSQELARIKNAEMLLRTKIFRGLFENPVEGTNKHNLAEGWVLKATHTIRRDVDMGSLQAYTTQNPETNMSKLTEVGINPELLFKWKPELAVREYRKLSEEQRKVLDNVLIIKDGSPGLEIVLPASAQKAKAEELSQA